MCVDDTNAKEEEKKKRYEKYFVLIDQTDNWFYGCGLPRLFKKKQYSIKRKKYINCDYTVHTEWLCWCGATIDTLRFNIISLFHSVSYFFPYFLVSSVFCFDLVRVVQIMLIFISFFFLLIFFDSFASVASFTQIRDKQHFERPKWTNRMTVYSICERSVKYGNEFTDYNNSIFE